MITVSKSPNSEGALFWHSFRDGKSRWIPKKIARKIYEDYDWWKRTYPDKFPKKAEQVWKYYREFFGPVKPTKSMTSRIRLQVVH